MLDVILTSDSIDPKTKMESDSPIPCMTKVFDEYLNGEVSRHPLLADRLEEFSFQGLAERQQAAEVRLREKGITFAVYGHTDGTEKVWPFDVVPRPMSHTEWVRIESGLKQRIRALNLYLDDIYGPQKILNDGVVPRELVLTAKTYRPQLEGFRPPKAGHGTANSCGDD